MLILGNTCSQQGKTAREALQLVCRWENAFVGGLPLKSTVHPASEQLASGAKICPGREANQGSNSSRQPIDMSLRQSPVLTVSTPSSRADLRVEAIGKTLRKGDCEAASR